MEAPTLGLAEAAKACGISESTLRRKRPLLLAKGAVQSDKGWRIPVPVLVEMGLMRSTTAPDVMTAPDSPATRGAEALMTAPDEGLRGAVEALREKLAEAEKRAAVAEAVASERERIIETQARALRMLEAGPSKQPATTESPVVMPSAGAAETPLAPHPEPTPDTEKASTQAGSRLWHRLLSRL